MKKFLVAMGLAIALATPAVAAAAVSAAALTGGGAEAVRRGAAGADPVTPLVFLAAITLATLALAPFAAAAALRVNLR